MKHELCSEGCMEYGNCDLSCLNEIKSKYSKGECSKLFVLFDLLMREYDFQLTENKLLKEHNDSLMHINGHLEQQNKHVPEMEEYASEKTGEVTWAGIGTNHAGPYIRPVQQKDRLYTELEVMDFAEWAERNYCQFLQVKGWYEMGAKTEADPITTYQLFQEYLKQKLK